METIMWRLILLFSLSCSVTLNIYFFMQLNIHAIEDKFQQEVSDNSQQGVVTTKKDKGMQSLTNQQSAQQVVNQIKNAINTKDYFNASYLMNTLARDHQAQLSTVRLFWLHATQALIHDRLFTDAENSISAYLSFQADDGDFLYQQVDLYWQQQLPLLAIKHAYEVQYHVFNEVKIANAVNSARDFVKQHVEVLINDNLWLELRDFVEEILLFDPQNQYLPWLLSRAQYQLGEFEDARHAITPLLSQPNYKIKAQVLLAKIEAALRGPQNIALRRQGEHFIVQGLINDTFNVSLMLDTGASISLLSESALSALNQYTEVNYIEDLNLNTAGGTVTASVYQVAEFAIQDYIVNDFVFAVSPSYSNESGEGNDGLLGMNFLKSFDFHIDQNNNQLILKNK